MTDYTPPKICPYDGAIRGHDDADECAEREHIAAVEFDRRWAEIESGENIDGVIEVIETASELPEWRDVVKSLIRLNNDVTQFNAESFLADFDWAFDKAVAEMKSTGKMPEPLKWSV